MRRVTVAAATEIAYEREGSGPPLILLHGGSGTRRFWDPVREPLARDFTLVVPDRRGRGASGDGQEYALEREVEDLQALADALEEDPIVFGHSFGGLVALVAAATVPVDRLILYEPALLVGEHRGDDLAARMRDRLEAGDRLGAMRLFIEEAGGVADVEALPWWPEEARLDLVETVVRENVAVEAYELADEPAVDVPTLLLTGEHGPSHLRDAVFELETRLPKASVVELDGVGHVGVDSAPERVADAVTSFVHE
jgi:pimeloyl-ACP methyl ester carboxylesterase